MPKYRDFAHLDVFPASFTDALQEFIGTMATPFVLSHASPTSIQIVAGAGNDQVGIGVNGLWRYRTSTVSASHPGGAAGTHDVYVTASNNVFAAGDVDNTDYSFGLEIRTSGTPATYAYRKIGTVVWDGTKVASVQQLVGGVGGAPGSAAPPGAIMQYAGAAAPSGWLLCNGGGYDPAVYPGLAAAISNTYGGTVASPLLPDLRGRVAAGFDAAQTEFNTLGKTGGAKTVALDLTMIPSHDHGGGAHAHTIVAAGTGIGIYAAGTGIGIYAANTDHRHWTTWNRVTTGNFAGSPGNNVVTGLNDWPAAGYTSTISSYAQEGNQNHAHGVSDPTHAHSISDPGHGHTVNPSGATITPQGGGQAHTNIQPYIALNHIIKT